VKILIIDDSSERHWGFAQIYPNDQITQAYTVEFAIKYIEAFNFDLIHLDHDLNDYEYFNDGRKPKEHTGMEICSYLIKKGYLGRVIIHSWNTVASFRMRKMFEDAGITVMYEPYVSYTSEQLNRKPT